ncbi:hypothetical protein OKA05_22850 [Luteolibacter arcticus]|uniref:DUF3990 domain-containing protein n=1 Tax=Luteolibacter arcticus TaxID=1581411 RepID=A0ABT3GPI1_9BACT|nr:hypothetical protein [Luteolibacter arcticus]MCW1925418.1 hypothetical protein [Luteolibacter arcticus]
MNLSAYQRHVIGFHGCDAKVASEVIEKGISLRPSEETFDWLGSGIYFWEHGPDRAFEWAKEKQSRGEIENPAVVGALIQLGICFDLLDTHYTRILGPAFKELETVMEETGGVIPENRGGDDLLRRERDCMVLNWTLERLKRNGQEFHTVRGMFPEGAKAFEGSGIRLKSHIQVAVREPSCIIGYFRPT